MNAGLVNLSQGKLDEASQSMQRAQTIRTPWKDTVTARLLRRDFAKGYYNIGVLAAARHDADAAKQAFEQAASILEILVAQQPLDLEQKLLLATCVRLVGDSIAGGDDSSLAIPSYQRALTLFLSLANRNPEVFEYQLALAGVYMNLANVQKETARKSAWESLTAAIELLDKLNDTQPTPAQQRDLAIALRTAIRTFAHGMPSSVGQPSCAYLSCACRPKHPLRTAQRARIRAPCTPRANGQRGLPAGHDG